MNILITGARGFVGRNLCVALEEIKAGYDQRSDHKICENPSEIVLFEYDLDSSARELDEYCEKADFVFHLAGINRPNSPNEFMEGNFGFSSVLLDTLKKHGNTCPVMLSSSVQ